MPKRSRLYNVQGLTNRQRRAILEEQQRQPGANEVEDLQRAYGRLFNQLNKYLSQLQNVTNVTRGISRQTAEIGKAENAYRRAARAANLYLQTGGRTIRAFQAFVREGRSTINVLRDTARATRGPISLIRSYGRSLNTLRGNERPLRAILKVLQQTSTTFGRTRRNSDATRASFDLLRQTGRRYRDSISRSTQDTEHQTDAISLLNRTLRALNRTQFGIQFGRTFRQGSRALDEVNSNAGRLGATLALIVRPLGIINNEYRRLTQGRHRRLALEFLQIYRAVQNVGVAFQQITGALTNLSNNANAFVRALRRINRAATFFGRIGLIINIITFSLHGLIELTLNFRRNVARVYLSFERVRLAAQSLFNYIRSQQAQTDFPGLRDSLFLARVELLQTRQILRDVRQESGNTFDRLVAGAILFDNVLDRTNRRLAITRNRYSNLIPQRGPNEFERLVDRAFIPGQATQRLSPAEIRRQNRTTTQGRQEEFSRIVERLDTQIRLMRQQLLGRGVDLTLPSRGQLGGLTGRGRPATRRNQLIDQLTQIQGRQLAPDVGSVIRLRTQGPEPGDFREPNLVQRLRQSINREVKNIIEEERLRQERGNEVLRRLKAERARNKAQERAIRAEQQEIEQLSAFDEMIRENIRRNLPGDDDDDLEDRRRTSRDVERERRARGRREPGSIFDDPNRLGMGFGFLRFGENAEPLFERLSRGLSNLNQRFRRTRDNITENNEAFNRMGETINRNSQEFNRFGSRLQRNGIRVFNFGRHLLVLTILLRGAFLFSLIGAGTALVFFTSRIAQSVRDLERVRRTLGLSANELRAWQLVAADSGFAINDLSRVFDTLDKQVQQFTQNQNEQVIAFSKLNITLRDLKNLDIGGIFQLVGNRLQNISRDSERIALATALFGEHAFAALSLAARGTDAINNSLNEYRDRPLGSPEELANIRRLDAVFKRLQLTLQSVGVTLTSAIADRLVRGLEAFERLLIRIEQANTEEVKGIIDSIVTFFKIIAVIITSAILVRLGAVFGAIVKSLFGIGAGAKAAAGGLGRLRGIGTTLLRIFGRQGLATLLLAVTLPLIAKALSQIDTFKLNLQDLAADIPEPETATSARIDEEALRVNALRKQGELQLGILQRIRTLSNQQDDITESVRRRTNELLDAIDLTPQERSRPSYEFVRQEIETFQRAVLDATREAEALREEIATRKEFELDIDPELFKRLEILEEFIKRIREERFGEGLTVGLSRELRKLDELDTALERVNDFRSAIDNSAEAVGRFLIDISSHFGDFSEFIKDATRELAQTIIKELQQALIADPIIDFLKNQGQSLLQGLSSGGGGGGGILGFLGNLFGGSSGLDFAQEGGLHQGPTIVGEAGPELVNFRSPARVYSNQDLMGALGGLRQTNVFNISGSDADTVRRAIAEAAPILVESAKRGVVTDVGRPSSMRRALRGT